MRGVSAEPEEVGQKRGWRELSAAGRTEGREGKRRRTESGSGRDVFVFDQRESLLLAVRKVEGLFTDSHTAPPPLPRLSQANILAASYEAHSSTRSSLVPPARKGLHSLSGKRKLPSDSSRSTHHVHFSLPVSQSVPEVQATTVVEEMLRMKEATGRTKRKEKEQVDSVLVGDVDVSRAWKEAKEEDRKAKDRGRIWELEEEVKRLRDEVSLLCAACDAVACRFLGRSSRRTRRPTEPVLLGPALPLRSSARRSNPHQPLPLRHLLRLRLLLSASNPTGRTVAIQNQFSPVLARLFGSVRSLPCLSPTDPAHRRRPRRRTSSVGSQRSVRLQDRDKST